MLDYLIGSLYVLFIGLIVGDFGNASFWSEFSIARAAIWKEYKLKAPDFDEKKHLAYVAILRHRGAIMIGMSVTHIMRTAGSVCTMILASILMLVQFGPSPLHMSMIVHQVIALLVGQLYLNVVNGYVAKKMDEQGTDVIAESAANLHRELGRNPTINEIMAETIEVFRADLVWEVVQLSKPFYLQWRTFWLIKLPRLAIWVFLAFAIRPFLMG